MNTTILMARVAAQSLFFRTLFVPQTEAEEKNTHTKKKKQKVRVVVATARKNFSRKEKRRSSDPQNYKRCCARYKHN